MQASSASTSSVRSVTGNDDGTLRGRTVGITADRRWREQAELLVKRGAVVVHGPTLETVDLSRDSRLHDVTEELIAAPPDYVVATTGMGMRLWIEAATSWGQGEQLLGALAGARLLARGAKAASTLRAAGLTVWWQAPNERMDEVIERLGQDDLDTARVAVQLFDPSARSATLPLGLRGAVVVEVLVYRWRLPPDTGPALDLARAIAGRRVDAVTFTSQPAVHHLFSIAAGAGVADDVRCAFNSGVMAACVGPVCAQAALEEGVAEPVWPHPPRLPAMVRLLTQQLGRADAGPGRVI